MHKNSDRICFSDISMQAKIVCGRIARFCCSLYMEFKCRFIRFVFNLFRKGKHNQFRIDTFMLVKKIQVMYAEEMVILPRINTIHNDADGCVASSKLFFWVQNLWKVKFINGQVTHTRIHKKREFKNETFVRRENSIRNFLLCYKILTISIACKTKIDFVCWNESEIQQELCSNRRKSIKFLDCAICVHRKYIKVFIIHHGKFYVFCWTDVTKSVTGIQTIDNSPCMLCIGVLVFFSPSSKW